MLRSLYAGVSGLQAHQTKMDVIGNNIANVNTYGFKGSRVTFRDIYYQTSKNGGAGTESQGGTNSSQVGYGVGVGSIDKIMSRSSFQSTSSTLDIAIAGEGFFQVQDKVGNIAYTRAGIFNVDNAGNVVDASGKFVLGTMAGNVTNSGSLSPTPGNAMLKIKVPDAPTNGNRTVTLGGADITGIPVASNHGLTLAQMNDPTQIVYRDENGGKYTITVTDGAGVADAFTLPTAYEKGPPEVMGVMTLALKTTAPDAMPTTTGELQTRLNAALKAAKTAAGPPAAGGTPPPTPLQAYAGGDMSVMTLGVLSGSADLQIRFSAGGADSAINVKFAVAATANATANAAMSSDGLTMTITLPFGSKFTTLDSLVTKANEIIKNSDGITDDNFKGGSLQVSVDSSKVAGKAGVGKALTSAEAIALNQALVEQLMGSNAGAGFQLESVMEPQKYSDLTSFNIGPDGVMTGQHPTLGSLTFGRIDIATFDNPPGLDEAGNTYFSETPASGKAKYCAPGFGGSGELMSSALEMSNVSLAQEFADMITTQRGFQANSRMITTSDTMLEELINLKR